MPEPTAGSRPPNDHPERWHQFREFVYVDRSFRDVRRHVAARPQGVLAGSLQAHVAGLDLQRDVRMVNGDLQVGVHSARMPVRWEDPRVPAVFPFLEGTLEFVPVAAGRRPTTQIGFFGRYRPPLGVVGAIGDRFVGRRLVIDSVLAFLDELSRRLEREVPSLS